MVWKTKRKDYKYNFLIPIKYNFKKTTTGLETYFYSLTKITNPQPGVLL